MTYYDTPADEWPMGALIELEPANDFVKMHEVPGSLGAARFHTLARAPGDMLWIADGEDRLVQFDTETGLFMAHPLPSPDFAKPAEPFGVAVADDGNIWFTCWATNVIGCYDPHNPTWDAYPVSGGGATGKPVDIAFSGDGTVWFTTKSGGSVQGLGSLDPATGAVTLRPIPDGMNPFGIAEKDGVIWFLDHHRHTNGALVKYDIAADSFSYFDVPASLQDPHFLVIDSEGLIWLTAFAASAIGIFDPASESFSHRALAPGTHPMGICKFPGGEIWWAETWSTGQGGAGRIVSEGPTVTVPGDYAIIQEAIDAVQDDFLPGTVVVESNAVFHEPLHVSESVTLQAGSGYQPTVIGGTYSLPALRVNASEDFYSEVNVSGIRFYANVNAAVSVSNSSSYAPLDVILESVEVEAEDIQSGISVAAATLCGDIELQLTNSRVELRGGVPGWPRCLRLNPFAYNVSAAVKNCLFRFSGAGGISIEPGRNDKSVTATIDANRFEGFDSDAGTGLFGVRVSGTGGSSADRSVTETAVTNNFFVNAGTSISVDGREEHTHRLEAVNNTIVDSREGGIILKTYEDSAVEASIKNNIITGTTVNGIYGGYGIYANNHSGALSCETDYNLFFGNASGSHYGVSPGANALFTDPLFRSPAAGDYHLRAGSPAIDAGISGEWVYSPFLIYSRIAPYTDFDGDSRTCGFLGETIGCCDIGADEYIPCAMPWVPLLLMDD
jgi:virginiamycin B lyase